MATWRSWLVTLAFFAGLLCPVALRSAMYEAPVPPCGDVPVQDTLNGSTCMAPCYTPRDAARPTAMQAATVTTDASGTWSVKFAKGFVSSNPVIQLQPVWVGGMPVVCNVATRSQTTATGRCWQATVSTVKGAVGAVLSALVSPFADGAPNVPVMIVAREPTQ